MVAHVVLDARFIVRAQDAGADRVLRCVAFRHGFTFLDRQIAPAALYLFVGHDGYSSP